MLATTSSLAVLTQPLTTEQPLREGKWQWEWAVAVGILPAPRAPNGGAGVPPLTTALLQSPHPDAPAEEMLR